MGWERDHEAEGIQEEWFIEALTALAFEPEALSTPDDLGLVCPGCTILQGKKKKPKTLSN